MLFAQIASYTVRHILHLSCHQTIFMQQIAYSIYDSTVSTLEVENHGGSEDSGMKSGTGVRPGEGIRLG